METTVFVKQNAGKAKSLHDAVDDPKLSKEPVKVKSEKSDTDDEYVPIKEEQLDEDEAAIRRQRIKDKLKSKSSGKSLQHIKKEEVSDSDEDQLLTHEEEKKLMQDKKK